MATQKQINDFINKIAPVIQKECINLGYKYPSAIIAQACHESNYGLSTLASKYHNYFGMKCSSTWKGASVNMATWEEYKPGEITNISANFRAYSSIEEGVKGYFDFIKYVRYKNLKEAESAQDYIVKIKNDGWATDSKYIDKVCNILVKYDLVKYDNVKEDKPIENVVNNTNYTTYTVVRGDSLWSISYKLLHNALRWREIAELNNITGTIIHIGQVLKIPK